MDNKEILEEISHEEETNQPVSNTGGDGQVEDLKAQIEEIRAQLNEKNDLLLRTAAEYDNYRKRTKKELDDRYEDAMVITLKRILPSVDNFERAISQQAGEFEDYKKGVEMIFRQLAEAIGSLGVKEIGSAGEQFDPSVHNAVMHIDDEACGPNEIVEVFEKGYMLNDRVIRHAMVKVAN